MGPPMPSVCKLKSYTAETERIQAITSLVVELVKAQAPQSYSSPLNSYDNGQEFNALILEALQTLRRSLKQSSPDAASA